MVLTLCHFSSCHHSIVEANSTREHRRVLSLLCCSAGVEETGRLACPFCGKAPREAAASWESALTSFTPHLLLCAHHPKQSVGARSRRKIYGAGHLSMSLLFSPLFSEPCSLRCFTTFSKFPSCSSVWRICHDMIQWFTTNSKEKAHIRHLTTWSHLAARTLKFSYYQGYEKHSKTPSKWGESHSFCIQTHLKGLLVALVKYYEHNVKPLVAWWECSTSCPPHKSLVHIKPKISLTVGYQSVALLCGDELSVPEVIHQRLHPHLHLCKTSLTFHANDLQTINLHSSTK